MNDRERDEYKPQCNRCGQLVTDIRWVDVSRPGGPIGVTPGRVRCSTDGCYDARGSRETGLLQPGGLNLDDHAWLRQHRRLATP